MPTGAFVHLMCSRRRAKNWLEQVQARHMTDDACISQKKRLFGKWKQERNILCGSTLVIVPFFFLDFTVIFEHVLTIQNTSAPSRPPATDLIFGQPRDAHASLATDPVLLKTDMFPTYHLASVVDDYEMGITHVFRGEVRVSDIGLTCHGTHIVLNLQEWLPSLPLHLDIYASLKLPTPTYAHLPILLNADGSKMSKRHGDVQVVDFIVCQVVL